MKAKIITTLLISVTGFNLHAQDTLAPSHRETIDFIETSIAELKSADAAGDVPFGLKEYYNWFQTDMETCEKQPYFEDFMQKITDSYKAVGKLASFKFTTPVSGATIKFQTIYETFKKISPRQADNPTNDCKVQLAPGQYYVWAERNGKVTSDKKRRVYVTMNTSQITINEN